MRKFKKVGWTERILIINSYVIKMLSIFERKKTIHKCENIASPILGYREPILGYKDSKTKNKQNLVYFQKKI